MGDAIIWVIALILDAFVLLFFIGVGVAGLLFGLALLGALIMGPYVLARKIFKK